ncbi:hypothetical protein K1719_004363 [Acacia pycnantha]|nr:hypothetical protein K1719_004363 [Acacia pycnantha]
MKPGMSWPRCMEGPTVNIWGLRRLPKNPSSRLLPANIGGGFKDPCKTKAIVVETCRVIWAPHRASFHHGPLAILQMGHGHSGPFKTKTRQLRWLIVAIDYFTKWIEAEPLTTISSARVQRFGVGFRDLIYEYRIQHHFASVEHPQSNGQAEAANKVILEGLKKRMLEADTFWADQLPFVLWGNRTTARHPLKKLLIGRLRM